ncbi:MAG: AI-2E family transporter [Pyrinomonadaceae bacterium]|nr:AI-2E family transporter [Pyrinomonadaceae bacterium]
MENNLTLNTETPRGKRIFTQRTLAVCGIVTAIVLGVLLVVYAVDALLLAFAAILLAVFLRSLTVFVKKYTKLSDGFSLALVLAALAVISGFSIYSLAGNVAEQVRQLQNELPNSIANLRGQLEQFGWGRAIIEQIPPTSELYENIKNVNWMSGAGGFFSTTAGVFTKLFIFLVLGLFLAVEPQTYTNGFLYLVPKSRRARASETIEALGQTLQWWLIGKFGSMLAIGVLTWIGLSILGIPLALTLGILTALLTFIPNIGPVVSVFPAALLALTQDPIKAVYVVGLYVLVQIIESNLITPYIERQTVALPPALTISMQLILSVFVGGLGLILATPLVAAGLVLVQMLYVEDILGDDIKTPDDETRQQSSNSQDENNKNEIENQTVEQVRV